MLLQGNQDSRPTRATVLARLPRSTWGPSHQHQHVASARTQPCPTRGFTHRKEKRKVFTPGMLFTDIRKSVCSPPPLLTTKRPQVFF